MMKILLCGLNLFFDLIRDFLPSSNPVSDSKGICLPFWSPFYGERFWLIMVSLVQTVTRSVLVFGYLIDSYESLCGISMVVMRNRWIWIDFGKILNVSGSAISYDLFWAE